MRNVSSAYPSIEYVNISSVSLEPPLTALDDLLTRFYLSKFVPLLSGNDNEALFRASRKRITRPSGERNVMTVKILWRNRKRIMAGKRRETPFLFNTRAGISSKGKSVGSFNNGGCCKEASEILYNVSLERTAKFEKIKAREIPLRYPKDGTS